MTDKQTVAAMLDRLPADATLVQIAEAYWKLSLERNDNLAFGSFYRAGLTVDDLNFYLNPQCDMELGDVIKDLEAKAKQRQPSCEAA